MSFFHVPALKFMKLDASDTPSPQDWQAASKDRNMRAFCSDRVRKEVTANLSHELGSFNRTQVRYSLTNAA